jgi:hypothetical protein
MILGNLIPYTLALSLTSLLTTTIISKGKSETRQKYRHCPLVLHSEWDRFYYSEADGPVAVFYLEVMNNGEFRDSELSRMIMKAMPTNTIDQHTFRTKALSAMRGENVGSQFHFLVEPIRKGVKEQRKLSKTSLEQEDELDWINRSFKDMGWWERLFWDMCVRDYRMLRYPRNLGKESVFSN